MGRWIAVMSLLTAACGGASKEPATPVAELLDEPSSRSANGDEDERESAPEETEATHEESSASAEDVQKVLQLVIDDGELEQYLKLGEPGRFPLKIAGDDVPSGAELTKGTKPVERVSDTSDEKKAVLEFTKVEVGAKKATVSFRYDIEGIRGTATLKKGEFGWELVKSRIVER
jgi:hypothetical protein